MNTPLKTIEWSNGKVRFLDQTRLPVESVVLEIDDYRDMIEAIRSLRIRGAPALGVATAYGIVLGAREAARDAGANGAGFAERVREAAREIAASRPTAVNVAWAAVRMERTLADHDEPETAIAALLEEAERIVDEDLAAGRAMGAHGAALIPDDATVLTHCNAGGLATSGYGTALGVIKSAREDGKSVRVMATETRPLLQGSAPDFVGAGARRRGDDADHRLDGGAFSQIGSGYLRRRRGRPHRDERRRGQQNRHLHPRGAGQGERRALLRGRAGEHHRPRGERRRPDPHRGAAARKR